MTSPLDGIPGIVDGRRRRDLVAFVEFLEGDAPPEYAAEIVTTLCILKSIVARSGVTSFPDTPADCFCGASTMKDGWHHSGDEVRFIIRATLDAIRARTTPPDDSIRCPRCGAVSYHPGDIANRYCGRCHWWTSDPQLGAPEVLGAADRQGILGDIE